MFRKLFFLLPLFSLYGAEPPVPESKVLANVDFLFWTAGVDGSELALSANSVSDTEVKRSWAEMDGKWEPGARASLGYRFGHFDEWQLSALWTYYHGRGDGSAQADEDFLFARQGWMTFLGPEVGSAQGHWNLNLNVADLKLERTYALTSQIKASPYVAGRAAFLALNLQAGYSSLWTMEDVDHDVTFFAGNTHFAGDSKYLSGGICTGSSISWNFNSNWSLFGDLGVSLLYGQFKVEEDFDGFDLQPDDDSNPILAPIRSLYSDEKMRVRTALDLLLGFKWARFFQDGRSFVSLFAGYELYQWFALNQLFTVARSIESYPISATTNVWDSNFTFDSKDGDIGLQGVTVRLNVEF